MELSNEQKHFIEVFEQGNNVFCDAVAGGAKTTTSMEVIERNKSKSFFCFCYNRFLADSNTEKAKERERA
jgi:hypothetical protein